MDFWQGWGEIVPCCHPWTICYFLSSYLPLHLCCLNQTQQKTDWQAMSPVIDNVQAEPNKAVTSNRFWKGGGGEWVGWGHGESYHEEPYCCQSSTVSAASTTASILCIHLFLFIFKFQTATRWTVFVGQFGCTFSRSQALTTAPCFMHRDSEMCAAFSACKWSIKRNARQNNLLWNNRKKGEKKERKNTHKRGGKKGKKRSSGCGRGWLEGGGGRFLFTIPTPFPKGISWAQCTKKKIIPGLFLLLTSPEYFSY